ncbi:MAG TPA: SCO family protein [Bryobacteraceae bacterium]|nr:SCO family protein [Bryobacteraceae bacterium]
MKFAVVAVFCATFCACVHRTSALPVFSDVPEFHLTSQDGQPFDSKVLAGNVWLADFIYTTCPGPCPRMTSQMHEVQSAVENIPDVKLVSFTVDPQNDTPLVLTQYAKAHAAAAGRWYFLTGAPSELQRMDRDVFKLGDLNAGMEHSTRFVLVDRESRIRGYYDTSEAGSIARVIQDINTLARERS